MKNDGANNQQTANSKAPGDLLTRWRCGMYVLTGDGASRRWWRGVVERCVVVVAVMMVDMESDMGWGFWVLWVVVVGDGAVMSWIAGSWIVGSRTVGNGPEERG